MSNILREMGYGSECEHTDKQQEPHSCPFLVASEMDDAETCTCCVDCEDNCEYQS